MFGFPAVNDRPCPWMSNIIWAVNGWARRERDYQKLNWSAVFDPTTSWFMWVCPCHHPSYTSYTSMAKPGYTTRVHIGGPTMAMTHQSCKGPASALRKASVECIRSSPPDARNARWCRIASPGIMWVVASHGSPASWKFQQSPNHVGNCWDGSGCRNTD